MSNLRRLVRDERGFTLVELLVTIVITAIVLSTITLAVAQGFQATTTTNTRLDRSNIADFAARYFGADVADSATTQPGVPCGAAGTLLDIAKSNGSSVSYAITADGTDTVLERRYCNGGAPAVTRLGSSRTPFQVDPSGTTCPAGANARCSLAITWSGGDGNFALSGTRRAG